MLKSLCDTSDSIFQSLVNPISVIFLFPGSRWTLCLFTSKPLSWIDKHCSACWFYPTESSLILLGSSNFYMIFPIDHSDLNISHISGCNGLHIPSLKSKMHWYFFIQYINSIEDRYQVWKYFDSFSFKWKIWNLVMYPVSTSGYQIPDHASSVIMNLSDKTKSKLTPINKNLMQDREISRIVIYINNSKNRDFNR